MAFNFCHCQRYPVLSCLTYGSFNNRVACKLTSQDKLQSLQECCGGCHFGSASTDPAVQSSHLYHQSYLNRKHKLNLSVGRGTFQLLIPPCPRYSVIAKKVSLHSRWLRRSFVIVWRWWPGSLNKWMKVQRTGEEAYGQSDQPAGSRAKVWYAIWKVKCQNGRDCMSN